MHRFFLPPAECKAGEFTLPESESHHGLHVLRLRERERLVVLDGAGTELLCEVISTDHRQLKIRVLQRNPIPPLPCHVTLAQAITRGKSMEMIVQKATELGVSRIVPIRSERSVVSVDDETGARKVGRWEATVIEAIKQCGSAWLPHLEPPMTSAAFLSRSERFDLVLVASLRAGSGHPRRIFERYLAENRRKPKTVCMWVGPEGDFTPAEMNAIQSSGALPVTLGPLVLRSETAAIYCLSMINYETQSPAD